MQPGRELDALVAERVMGWERINGAHPEIEAAGGMWRTPQGRAWSTMPHYSTDIAAAWKVVDRITRPPETLEEAGRAANARFGLWWRDANLWAYDAPEAAYAICLAALRAVGWEDPNA